MTSVTHAGFHGGLRTYSRSLPRPGATPASLDSGRPTEAIFKYLFEYLNMPDARLKTAIYEQIARITKAASSPGRLELLEMLTQGPKTVEVLARQTSQTLANASHHLKVLREAGLTRTRIEGTHRFVSLRRDDLDARFPGLLDAVLLAATAAPA